MKGREYFSGGRNKKRTATPNRPSLVPMKAGQRATQIQLAKIEGQDQFLSDGAHGSRFKWMISTCIAGVVGISAIGVAMYASKNMENGDGFLASMESATMEALNTPTPEMRTIADNDLRASLKKSDRIALTARGLSTRHIIHDTVVQTKDTREFISIKPYARLVARLSTTKTDSKQSIPPFNPFQLYSTPAPSSDKKGVSPQAENSGITRKVVDLIGGVLPVEDNETLSLEEIQKIIAATMEIYLEQNQIAQVNTPGATDNNGSLQDASLQGSADPAFHANTTVIEKRTSIEEALESLEVKELKVKAGDSVARLLARVGAENWQTRAIIEAMKDIFPAKAIQPGQTARFTLVPAPSGDDRLEPIALSLFTKDTHHVTVYRNDGGQYVASKNPLDLAVGAARKSSPSKSQRATIYSSIYQAALDQKIPDDKIMSLLRIHSYHVDFKRRVQPGDSFEAFYDLADPTTAEEEAPNELLYTSTSIGGNIKRFYRFRSVSGKVDYYDENGSSSKKFLMRKPVRGARYTSGFGYRRHPLLGRRKMHTGADWAAPRGTPILAAGNGVIEAAGRKGGYGNYIRIRHANGYKTAYAHMYRFAKGIRTGVKVKQGQVIGRVGSSGLSSGPHLHFEVLVNNRHVDPMKIKVPSGRDLKGRQLQLFLREKARINELMSRTPVKTRVSTQQAAAAKTIDTATTALSTATTTPQFSTSGLGFRPGGL